MHATLLKQICEMRRWASQIVLAALAMFSGCSADSPRNPSFSLRADDAKIALAQMRDTPKALARPVIVLAGFLDPGVLSSQLARHIRRLTGDDRVAAVGFAFCGDFEACRERLIDHVQREFPGDDPAWTTEVDVVAISMGGLVARDAAAAPEAGSDQPRRLRIARLFTISTPHQGAALASLPTFDKRRIAMRAGSDFLQRLDSDADAKYPIFAYARLGDVVVGAANAAPPGRTAWWVPNRPLEPAHLLAACDPRIVADIARRLRGEEPFATEPPAELPNEDAAAEQADAAPLMVFLQ